MKRIGRPPKPLGSRVIDKQAFTVRLDAGVYLKLHERARRNRRRLGAEIETILEGAVQSEDLVLPSVPPAVALVGDVPRVSRKRDDGWFL